MHGKLVGDVLPPPRGLDGVDVADHVRDGHVGRGEFLHVAVIGREPGDGRIVALLFDEIAAAPADRPVRIVVDLAAFHVRRIGVEQRGEHADQARLGLPAQAQQNKIVARQYGVDDVRNHTLFEADDAGKQRLAALDTTDKIIPEFVFYRAASNSVFGENALAKSA